MNMESIPNGNDAAKKRPPPLPPRPGRKISGAMEKPAVASTERPRSTPPPLPPRHLREAAWAKREASPAREPGALQMKDVQPPFEITGFDGLQVAATLEKKNERKGKTEKRNEDNVIADPETGLIGVLDGLGGADMGPGAEASKAAETAIPEAYKAALMKTPKHGAEVLKRLVDQQLKKIGATDPARIAEHTKILTQMVEDMQTKDPEMARKALALVESFSMANAAVEASQGRTTACVGFIHAAPDGTAWAVVANVGDSAAFKRRANGEIVPMTKEDSLLNRMVDSGELSPERLAEMEADPGKAFDFPVTMDLVRAAGGGQREFDVLKGRSLPMTYKKLRVAMVGGLGATNPEPSLSIRRMDPGDELILASDGMVDMFEDPKTMNTDLAELSRVASEAGSQTERLEKLRQAAKSKKTEYKDDDDIAIISARKT